MRSLTMWCVLLGACGGGHPAVAPAPASPVAVTPTPPPAAPPAAPVPGIVVLDRAPADALVLSVRAYRWDCSIDHAHGIQTRDLKVPAGRAIKLVVHTPESPQLVTGIEVALVGTDAVRPVVQGRPVELAFRIDVPGTYEWKCPTIVPPRRDERDPVYDPVKPLTVLPAAEYDAFIAENNPDDPANRLRIGKQLYERKGCVACHTIDGRQRIGPSWAGIWGSTVTLADGSSAVVDAAYIKRSILEPTAFARPGYPPSMPSFEGQLRDAEIAAIVTFIQSLRDAGR